MDRHDMVMFDGGGGLGLSNEPVEHARFGDPATLNYFNRHESFQPRVISFQHHSHPAAAENASDFVMPQAAAMSGCPVPVRDAESSSVLAPRCRLAECGCMNCRGQLLRGIRCDCGISRSTSSRGAGPHEREITLPGRTSPRRQRFRPARSGPALLVGTERISSHALRSLSNSPRPRGRAEIAQGRRSEDRETRGPRWKLESQGGGSAQKSTRQPAKPVMKPRKFFHLFPIHHAVSSKTRLVPAANA